jgi:hypothetical protein
MRCQAGDPLAPDGRARYAGGEEKRRISETLNRKPSFDSVDWRQRRVRSAVLVGNDCATEVGVLVKTIGSSGWCHGIPRKERSVFADQAVLKSFGVCQRRIEPEEITRQDRKFEDAGKDTVMGGLPFFTVSRRI